MRQSANGWFPVGAMLCHVPLALTSGHTSRGADSTEYLTEYSVAVVVGGVVRYVYIRRKVGFSHSLMYKYIHKTGFRSPEAQAWLNTDYVHYLGPRALNLLPLRDYDMFGDARSLPRSSRVKPTHSFPQTIPAFRNGRPE